MKLGPVPKEGEVNFKELMEQERNARIKSFNNFILYVLVAVFAGLCTYVWIFYYEKNSLAVSSAEKCKCVCKCVDKRGP